MKWSKVSFLHHWLYPIMLRRVFHCVSSIMFYFTFRCCMALMWSDHSEPIAACRNHDSGGTSYLCGTFRSLLQPPAIWSPVVGSVAVVCDEEVVEEDVRGHGPELQAQGAEGAHPERLQVLKEGRVGDLPGLPHTLLNERQPEQHIFQGSLGSHH